MIDRDLRSTNALDYQDLPQLMGVMPKDFSDGYVIAWHKHDRDQLLYAISGIMRLETKEEAWIVPHNYALYIPAGTDHQVRMHGTVQMRTLYINGGRALNRSRGLGVFSVSNLLRELILALSDEPIQYDPDSRAGLIARIIELEIELSREISLNIPLPEDLRLQKLCAELLKDPSDRRTLYEWSDTAGASPRTLARLFKSELGMSFNQWRQRIRFHGALEGLNRGEKISKIAGDHGYQSASAFAYAFKKVMGKTPSEVSAN